MPVARASRRRSGRRHSVGGMTELRQQFCFELSLVRAATPSVSKNVLVFRAEERYRARITTEGRCALYIEKPRNALTYFNTFLSPIARRLRTDSYINLQRSLFLSAYFESRRTVEVLRGTFFFAFNVPLNFDLPFALPSHFKLFERPCKLILNRTRFSDVPRFANGRRLHRCHEHKFVRHRISSGPIEENARFRERREHTVRRRLVPFSARSHSIPLSRSYFKYASFKCALSHSLCK